jgi:hypothetical protein
VIRLAWRQFRLQAEVAASLLAVAAVLLISTRPHLAALYDVVRRAQEACASGGECRQVRVNVGGLNRFLQLFGTALVGLPAIIGAFWGAPLITREFENGTHRLVWTQSVTRGRWLAAKLAVVGSASVLATGLGSLLVTWWSAPIDAGKANRFGAGLFGERNIVPLGYAAFAFTVGVATGLLLRRTLPAMAVSLVAFLATRLAFTYLVRPNLIPPRRLSLPLDPNSIGFGSTNNGPDTLMPGTPPLPDAWIYSSRIVDGHGLGLTPTVLRQQCPQLGTTQPLAGSPAGHGVRVQAPDTTQSTLHDCVARLSGTYHELLTYQPANRYWLFQIIETAAFSGGALLLAGAVYWWLRRRPD